MNSEYIRQQARTLGGAALSRLQDNRLPGLGGASVREPAEVSSRRWRAVTVLADLADLGPLPELVAIGPDLETRLLPAPGGRGTEIAGRFVGEADAERIGDLRAALRRTKQLIEVGEVLRVEPVSHGARRPTLRGAAMEGAVARAPREGVL